MKITTKRRIALALGLTLMAPVGAMSASPAGAAEASTAASCRTLLSTTPAIEVDTNNDGYPEYRAPRIHDVTLCTEASYGYVVYPPTTENCSPVPKTFTCMAVRITVLPAYAGASGSAELCFTIEGDWAPQCNDLGVDDGAWTAPRVMCIGYDLGGGHPCDGSVFALE